MREQSAAYVVPNRFEYLLEALVGVRMAISPYPSLAALHQPLDDIIERATAEMVSIGVSPIFDAQVFDSTDSE